MKKGENKIIEVHNHLNVNESPEEAIEQVNALRAAPLKLLKFT